MADKKTSDDEALRSDWAASIKGFSRSTRAKHLRLFESADEADRLVLDLESILNGISDSQDMIGPEAKAQALEKMKPIRDAIEGFKETLRENHSKFEDMRRSHANSMVLARTLEQIDASDGLAMDLATHDLAKANKIMVVAFDCEAIAKAFDQSVMEILVKSAAYMRLFTNPEVTEAGISTIPIESAVILSNKVSELLALRDTFLDTSVAQHDLDQLAIARLMTLAERIREQQIKGSNQPGK